MTLTANPKLSANERKALEMDYGMKSGKLQLAVREAMLTYSARRLGFIEDYRKGSLPMLNESEQLLWTEWQI